MKTPMMAQDDVIGVRIEPFATPASDRYGHLSSMVVSSPTEGADMTWEHDAHPILKWAKLSVEHLPQIASLELAVLKVHVVMEEALRYLLAARLGLPSPENALSEVRIEFSLLLDLALAGNVDCHLRGAARALNDARNAAAHHVENPKFMHKLEIFCRETAYMRGNKLTWPTSQAAQLIALTEAFAESGSAVLNLAAAEEKKYG